MDLLAPFTSQYFRRLQQLEIHSKRSFLGSRQGAHTSLRRGHGLEFSDFRPYTSGDDFRQIDWRIYGRTDRIYVKQFREEEDLNVLCIVDTSSSMNFPREEPSKLRRGVAEGKNLNKNVNKNVNKFVLAKQLALSLGYVALTNGDTVTFSYLGQHLSPRYTGAKSLFKVGKLMEDISTIPDVDFVKEVLASAAYQKLPGKCFVISDFLFSFDKIADTLNILGSKNFDIAFIQVLSPEELQLSFEPGSFEVEDAETGERMSLNLNSSSKSEYASLLSDHIKAIEDLCNRRRVQYILVSTAEDFNNIVFSRFTDAGLFRM